MTVVTHPFVEYPKRDRDTGSGSMSSRAEIAQDRRLCFALLSDAYLPLTRGIDARWREHFDALCGEPEFYVCEAQEVDCEERETFGGGGGTSRFCTCDFRGIAAPGFIVHTAARHLSEIDEADHALRARYIKVDAASGRDMSKSYETQTRELQQRVLASDHFGNVPILGNVILRRNGHSRLATLSQAPSHSNGMDVRGGYGRS